MNVQKLIKSGKPTLAAMLLFGNHGYSIHIGRFKAADTIIDDLLIKSPLIVGLDETIVLECGGDMLGQVPDKLNILAFCRTERSVKEMMTFFNMKHRETFMKNYIHQLIEEGILTMTIPDKPRSSKQRYVTTPAGIKQLERLHYKVDPIVKTQIHQK